MALLFGAALLGMSDDKVHDQARVKRLQVVDDYGRPVVEITAGDLGGQLVLRSAGGKDIVRIQAEALGGAVRAYQSDERPATALYTYQMTQTKTAGAVETFDAAGRSAVTLGTGDDIGGPVSMGAHCPGGVLVVAHDGALKRVDACLLRELSDIVGLN